MFKWKKAAAILASAALAGSCAACGSNTAYAVTIDGVQVKAGIYIYYEYAAYVDLTQQLQSQDSELDVSDKEVVRDQKMDGVDTETWVKNKAMEYCQEYVAIEQKFEELGLELEEEDVSSIKQTVDSFWDVNGEIYEDNGIAKDSIRSILENSQKSNDVFMYYYDIGGEEGVTEDEIKTYYVENNARVRYIQFSLTDGNGEELDSDGKAEIKDMVEAYLEQLEECEGNEDALEEEMDAIQSEYNAYVTSISEEAAAETATSATDENGNEITATTTDTTTTVEETTTTTTTVQEDSAAVEDGSTDTTAVAETESTETTTTTSEGETDSENAETTTTTSPYANDSIIAKVTTDEDTDPEDITYTPSENAYKFIFDEAEEGVPGIVEDDDAYYLIVRLDITTRMTEDDLWTDDQKTSVVVQKYQDAFLEMQDDWVGAQSVEKNESAIKRYDPFKIDMESSSQ